MVRIPHIKIPSVRVGGIDPTSDIGTAIGGVQPTPITYLTNWKIVGNSEVHTLPYPDGVVLPTGYKRCEYLTFDGSSYINTGVKTANGVGVRTSFKTTTNLKQVFGTRKNGTNYGIMFGFLGYQGSNNAIAGYFSGVNVITLNNSMYNGNKHSVQLDSENCIIDGIEYSITRNSETESSLDITVGALNYNENIDDRIFIGNIYDTIIYNTQGELWHGIPCLDANDVPCFYDIVSQTAFYNQGSGNFTYKLYPQPTEIWSCGEYSATDGKYHIVVLPLGKSPVDIALTEPLRKNNDAADTIEFPSGTEGKALVTRSFKSVDMGTIEWYMYNSSKTESDGIYCIYGLLADGKQISVNDNAVVQNILTPRYRTAPFNSTYIISSNNNKLISYGSYSSYNNAIRIQDSDYNQSDSATAFKTAVRGVELIYELVTPTTELVDAPQIAEAESYSCVISQGGKAVEWSSFTTDSSE